MNKNRPTVYDINKKGNHKPAKLWITTGVETTGPRSADSWEVEFIDNWKGTGTGREKSNRHMKKLK